MRFKTREKDLHIICSFILLSRRLLSTGRRNSAWYVWSQENSHNKLLKNDIQSNPLVFGGICVNDSDQTINYVIGGRGGTKWNTGFILQARNVGDGRIAHARILDCFHCSSDNSTKCPYISWRPRQNAHCSRVWKSWAPPTQRWPHTIWMLITAYIQKIMWLDNWRTSKTRMMIFEFTIIYRKTKRLYNFIRSYSLASRRNIMAPSRFCNILKKFYSKILKNFREMESLKF
jgi:hypothetical protein